MRYAVKVESPLCDLLLANNTKTPFTPTHGCCGSRRMLYIRRDPQGIRTVCVLYPYVLCLWISAAIRSPILKVISCFTYAADAADKVSPYWLRTLTVYCIRRYPSCLHSPSLLFSSSSLFFTFFYVERSCSQL